ncbi:MAG TPA: cytochrome P450 [Chloroflexota bacterium]|nr:cytochrome P450 [Chloroflexota bacterium]
MSVATLEKPVPVVPRGRRAHWLFGVVPELRRGRLEAFSRWAREYGDFVMFDGHRVGVMLNHPDLVEEMLVLQQPHLHKTPLLSGQRLVFGRGLLVSEGDFWLRQRRLAQPAFHRARIATYGEYMTDYSQRMLDRWHDGDQFDAHAAFMEVTLRIVAKSLFGRDIGQEAKGVGHALRVLLEIFLKRINRPFRIKDSWPLPENYRYKAAVAQLNRIIYGIIAERRASGEDAGDLLSMLLSAQDIDGERMTDQQVRDEAMTLFLAGHETTANALSWTAYLLAQNPEVDAKLAHELRTVLNGRAPTVDDLPSLPYTANVITESMRLYPPAWVIGRIAVEPCTIGGQPIEPGTLLWASQWVVHHDGRWYQDPEQFRPERWTPEFQRQLPKFAYFPFGGGQRICIGNNFALMEASLILATVAQRYRLELVPRQRIEGLPSITLRPKYGIQMVARAR